MATYKVGDVLPAKQNTSVTNPGPVHDPAGLDNWLAAQAQDKAFNQNQVLLQEWHDRQSDSPDYAAQLGAGKSWAVLVAAAEAGGLDFQQQRLGPPVNSL